MAVLGHVWLRIGYCGANSLIEVTDTSVMSMLLGS